MTSFSGLKDQRATVKKFIYFNAGTVGIEERLLVKYGELTRRQELLDQGGRLDFIAAAAEIRRAGLQFMVLHELDFAIQRFNTADGKVWGGKRVFETRCRPRAVRSTGIVWSGYSGFEMPIRMKKQARKNHNRRFISLGIVNAGTPAGFHAFSVYPRCPDAGRGHQPGIFSCPVFAGLPDQWRG